MAERAVSIVEQVLASHAKHQTNLASGSARSMLAKDIVSALEFERESRTIKKVRSDFALALERKRKLKD